MNGKKILFAILTLILLVICVSACQAANLPHTAGREPATEQTESKQEQKNYRTNCPGIEYPCKALSFSP